MDRRDLQVLAALEGGLPLVREPFTEVGRSLGMSGDEVLERITRLRNDGVIRRFRARIDQQQVGIAANALVAWNCKGMEAAMCGDELAAFAGVTHCYERRPVPGRWDFSLYTVHHGRSRPEVEEEVQRIGQLTGLDEYLILFSTEEFKRVPNVRVRENGGGT